MPETFHLTPEQLDDFDRRGVLRLPGFYPQAVIDPMADRLWADLELRFGIRRDRPETWTVPRPAQFQALVRAGAFGGLMSPRLAALADALLGPGTWTHQPNLGGPLVTCPSLAWDLPRPLWHMDGSPGRHYVPLPVLIGFTFLAPVLPNGGGTLYVAGSHRVVMDVACRKERPMKSTIVRERLKTEQPWFARLLKARSVDVPAMMNTAAVVAGHDVQVQQMTGASGDVILMHPAMLHGLAHNGQGRPRMMLKVIVTRRAGAQPPGQSR